MLKWIRRLFRPNVYEPGHQPPRPMPAPAPQPWARGGYTTPPPLGAPGTVHGPRELTPDEVRDMHKPADTPKPATRHEERLAFLAQMEEWHRTQRDLCAKKVADLTEAMDRMKKIQADLKVINESLSANAALRAQAVSQWRNDREDTTPGGGYQ